MPAAIHVLESVRKQAISRRWVSYLGEAILMVALLLGTAVMLTALGSIAERTQTAKGGQ